MTSLHPTCVKTRIFMEILRMNKCLSILLLFLFMGCGEKKIDLSGNVTVKPGDFLAAFPTITSPYIIADTNVTKLADTISIGYKVLLQFFPDSTLGKIISNPKKISIHPIGKIEKEKEIYLLLSFTNSKKITKLVVFVTDKKNKFLAAKELLSTDMDPDYTHSVSINREPTFLVSKEKMGKENVMQFTRSGWAYNSIGFFMVVVNDTNEETKKGNVMNPIDTMPRKNKFSGDYVEDRMNFISIRDSKKIGSYLFFVHFEKNDGSCTGELKGEMKMKSTTKALYTANGDPCIIDFHFEGNEITIKEQGSCGNHRGIKCFFNDTFTKIRGPRIKKKN